MECKGCPCPCYLDVPDLGELTPDYCPFDAGKYANWRVVSTIELTPTVEKISDDVNHPNHYAEGREYEPIDVIEDWELGFNLGNVVKYISRAGRKDDSIQDLKKAEFYLKREIQRLKE